MKQRRRYTWKWGDPDILDAKTEWGCWIGSDKQTIMHPHLRQKKHHDKKWKTYGHEALHALFPKMSHHRIAILEEATGWFLHDFSGCKECDVRGTRRGTR